MNNLATQITAISTVVISVITSIYAIYNKVKANITKIKSNETVMITKKTLALKDLINKFVVEAEKKFEHGDNLIKLDYVISNVTTLLDINEEDFKYVKSEIEKTIKTIKDFNNKGEN
jgi:hypothetical protein